MTEREHRLWSSFPLDQIGRHQALVERKDIGIVGARRDHDPVMERRAERLDPCDVLNHRLIAARAPAHEWLVNAEIMAVAMYQNCGLAEFGRFLADRIAQLGETAGLLFRISGERRKSG